MQILATEAARTALAEQKGRLLEDFRLQLRQEAIRAMQSVILASKEDFTRLALKELNVAHEAGARANYSRWMEKIGQDMESARQHMLNQTKEVSQRVDSLAAATVERVQRSMEATRSEAVSVSFRGCESRLRPPSRKQKMSLRRWRIPELHEKGVAGNSRRPRIPTRNRHHRKSGPGAGSAGSKRERCCRQDP